MNKLMNKENKEVEVMALALENSLHQKTFLIISFMGQTYHVVISSNDNLGNIIKKSDHRFY